jgi:hypothetical protein
MNNGRKMVVWRSAVYRLSRFHPSIFLQLLLSAFGDKQRAEIQHPRQRTPIPNTLSRPSTIRLAGLTGESDRDGL